MKIKKLNKSLNICLPILTILVLLLIWFIAAKIVGEEIVLPTPSAVLSQTFSVLGKGVFWRNLINTVGRGIIAFGISFILGTSLAILVSFSKISRPIVGVIVSIIRAMPTIAVILLLLLWTNSKVASVVVTMLVVLPTMYSSMQVSLGKVDRDIITMMRSFKLSKKTQYTKYILPITLPGTIQTIGSGISLNLKLIVAAEVIAGTARSIGNMMTDAKIYFETAELFAIVLIMVVIAVSIELIFHKIASIVGGKYEA